MEGIGLRPVEQMVYELADGTRIAMDIGVAQIELLGKRIGGTVVFGDADAEPLLGVTVLESIGAVVDPRNQRLKKLPAIRLKAAAVASRVAGSGRVDLPQSATKAVFQAVVNVAVYGQARAMMAL